MPFPTPIPFPIPIPITSPSRLTIIIIIIQASKNHERAGTILTQFKRIQKWLKLINKKKTNAATMFEGGLKALKHWTADGTKCSNVKYGGTALSTLANCSTTATKNCDSSYPYTGIDSTLLNPCKADAEWIVESYYVRKYIFIFKIVKSKS